jgi:hypothetical protein
MIMMVNLCPAGSEGAAFAMFTTFSNSAHTLSNAIGATMLGIWDTSEEALASGDVQGFAYLTILTSCLQFSPIFFVWMLPAYREDLVHLMDDKFRSRRGGFIFLAVTVLGMIYAVANSVLNVYFPGWLGGGT